MKVSCLRKLALAGLFTSLYICVAGCQHRKQSPTRATATQSNTYTYTVRGIIEHLPPAGETGRQISIKTEAIGNFIGPDGKISPMAPMEMDYDLAKSVDTATLHPHEKIAFIYRVNWQSGLNQVSRIHALPPSTILSFQPSPLPTTVPAAGGKPEQN